MTTSTRIALAATVSVAMTHWASADLLTRDSADFINGSSASYEALVIPQNATPAWSSGGNISTYSANGELTLTTEYGNNRYFNTGTFWSDDVDRASGYTVEFRMRVDGITDTTANRGPLVFRIGDGTQKVELEWRANSVEWNVGESGAQSLSLDPTVYRTYRIAYDPSANGGAGAYAAWIDGNPVSSTLAGVNNNTANHLLFGDTSNTRYGGTTTWDYIRWDTTGAFAPVPEPASLTLIALSAALLPKRRSRKSPR